MNTPIEKLCKKQNQVTKHRWSSVPDQVNGGYYSCTECKEENSKRHRRKHWLRYLAQKANARHRADSEPMTEAILKELWDRQDGCCALTFRPFEEGGDWAASLDRIDSSQGYKRGNIRLTAWIINHVRGNLSDNKFLEVCKAVYWW